MNGMILIAGKEWRSFLGAERALLVTLGILFLVYSLSFALGGSSVSQSALWSVVFSVVVSSIFGNSLFVSERMNGAIEILLTSGISRDSVLFGKFAFGMALTLAMGAVPYALAAGWCAILGTDPAAPLLGGWAPALYAASSFVSLAAAAWLSVQLSSPRLVYFLIMLLLAAAGGAVFGLGLGVSHLAALLVGLGLAFLLLARHAYRGEKPIRPVNL